MKRALIIILLSLSFAGQAWAQSNSLTKTDKEFLTKDRRGATYELEAAKLAVRRAQREDVKRYAEKLVQDHSAYNEALEKLGKELGVTLPTEPAATNRAHLADLEKLNGKGFDTLFVKEAVRVNKLDKQDAEKEKAATNNKKIKDFIEKFARMDAEHETLAKQLEQAKS